MSLAFASVVQMVGKECGVEEVNDMQDVASVNSTVGEDQV